MTEDEIEAAIRPGLWRHFKGGLYRVHGLGRHSETGELVVVYEPLYSNDWHGAARYSVRPAAMFLEAIERDGYRGPRFAFDDDGSGE